MLFLSFKHSLPAWEFTKDHTVHQRCRCSGVIVAVVNHSNNFILTAGLIFI